MRLKTWRVLFPAYLSGILTALLMNCATGPKMATYISNPKQKGMDYFDARTGLSGFTDYDKTDKFVCHTPEDEQILLNRCSQK